MSLNKVALAGTVIGVPQSKTFGNQGKSLVTFMVETVDDFKGTCEQHEIKAFGKAADAAVQLQDGDTVFVDGKLASRRWEKNDKVSYFTEVVAVGISSKAPVGNRKADSPAVLDKALGNDELPF